MLVDVVEESNLPGAFFSKASASPAWTRTCSAYARPPEIVLRALRVLRIAVGVEDFGLRSRRPAPAISSNTRWRIHFEDALRSGNLHQQCKSCFTAGPMIGTRLFAA